MEEIRHPGENLSYNKTEADEMWRRFDALLNQIDRIPDAIKSTDPLEWDEHGLPK